MNRYDHRAIESKWQQEWASKGAYSTSERPKRKTYVLDMFPYPSGAGLHVGHPEGYTATDIVVRKLRAQGHDVLHPMGWDAFGLPAENYAIKTGTPPQETTTQSIARFRSQIQSFGFSYDWSREVNTSDPSYYRWTQWLFLLLYERGLAYQKEAPVNWCPEDQTVLANEQVIDGKCDRCGSAVIQRHLKQWFLKITDYADELVDALDALDWPEPIKAMQRNWIGRKQGVVIAHAVKDMDLSIDTFSAYPAWLFADTFIVLAPEHPAVRPLVAGTDAETEVSQFVEESASIAAADRTADRFEKKGVFTGRYALDPLRGIELPIWVANFALVDFGTGAIRCSAHDPRDYDFATKYAIPLNEVVARKLPHEPVNAHDNEGVLTNSGPFSGESISPKLVEKMVSWLEREGIARRETTYRLRDWLVSRQRYWGAPIPIVHCDKCGAVPVSKAELPVVLPTDVDFRPTGESPIARSTSFHAGVLCSRCGQPARRESDTMDTFVDSSWYFLRYADPHNASEPFAKSAVEAWLPVDLYVGGAEHAVLHLLYARFITKALADAGYLGIREPFAALRNQGLILGEDGQKMSKSKGNVINPDEIIEAHGADTLRVYEMFMGPFEDQKPWSTQSLIGIRRWLDRVWRLSDVVRPDATDTETAVLAVERAVKKVSNDIDAFKFNTAVSSLMIASNSLGDEVAISTKLFHRYLQLLAPFAPHLAQELYHQTGGDELIDFVPWPEPNSTLIRVQAARVPVQVDGKLRAVLHIDSSLDEVSVTELAKAEEGVKKHLEGREVVRTIYVPGKILNIISRNL